MLLFQFSYETPVYKSKNPSCKFFTAPCWRHCLKTVKIDESVGSIDIKTLKKYFHKNAEVLESILQFQGRRGFANKKIMEKYLLKIHNSLKLSQD
jgi:hypothetical protein